MRDALKEFRMGQLGATAQPEQDDDFVLDTNATLKKEDLYKPEYLNQLRSYMVRRKGVDYKDADDTRVVDDFVSHMRFFNANTVSTAGEVGFVSRGDDADKEAANRAYRIYDQLGNVFTNDGFYGAVSGVGEYVKAAASDPSNYIGLLTGGIARAGAAGVSLTGKQAVKEAVRVAGLKAAQSGANRQAAANMAQVAAVEAARRYVASGATVEAAGRVAQEVAKRAALEARKGLAREAVLKTQEGLFKEAGLRSLKQTAALDATAAVMQDIMAQNTYLEVGAQEEYSLLQTGFSSLLGSVGAGAQFVAGKMRGASGLAEEATGIAGRRVDAVVEEFTPVLKQEAIGQAGRIIMKEVDDWNAKVARGSAFTLDATPAELIKNIMLGSDGKSGLAKLFKDNGYKIGREKHISDVMTNVARMLPEQELARINAAMEKSAGFTLGDLAGSNIVLGDMLAKKINEAGKTLNVMSQVRKTLNSGLLKSIESLEDTLDPIVKREMDAAKKAQLGKYGQSVWRRLLVSSPATTALNVAGFGQYYVGQTMADMFNTTALTIKAAGQMTYNPAAAKESLRRARALTALQAQKISNLMDPYTTHDAYMKFLKENSDLEEILFETITGGIERKASAYGIDPNNKLYKNIEAVTNAANQLTGMRIQDSFTKSQMFMAELDKALRINKKTTLKDVLNTGDTNVIDEVDIQSALDTTLKSVFSKDYTTKEQSELVRSMAGFVEKFSQIPVLGTILPFGRFFNNVLATAYQWSPLASYELIKFAGRVSRKEGATITESDAVARMMVGSSAMWMAMQFDEPRRKEGLAYNEIKTSTGDILDMRNTFPFSLWLAIGRAGNLKTQGEDVPRELIEDITAQLAVGQFARDTQFANDLYNVFDIMFNPEAAMTGQVGASLGKATGNVLAGFTRPLDAVNKIVGFATGTDVAKDIRQGESGIDTLTQTSTRYIDNIIEAFIDKTDTLTGEELRVATREGQVYDPNPFARIFGITVKQARTATEKAYSMAEMHPWTASERTNIPAYDKALNTVVAPILEKRMDRLISTDRFQKANLNEKRMMVKNLLKDVKGQMRTDMEKGYEGAEAYRLRLANKVSNAGSKELRQEAQRFLRDKYGVSAPIKDMSFKELYLMNDYIDILRDVYKQ